MRCPADEARFLELGDDGVLFDAGLFRIRCDDFEVATRIQVSGAALTKRKKRVLRAAAGMDTAENRRNSCAFLDEGNAALKIAAAEENVIEQCRKASGLGFRCPNGRRYDRARGEREKRSA